MSDIPSDLILSGRDLRKIEKTMSSYSSALEDISYNRRKRHNRILYKYWGIHFGDTLNGLCVFEVFNPYKNFCVLRGKDSNGKSHFIKDSKQRIPFEDLSKLLD